MLILMYALFYSTCDYFSVCVKCFNIDVRIYSTLQYLLVLPFFLFFFLLVSLWLFCHFDIDVCIYSTCVFWIVKRILMLIMYSVASS